MPNVTKCFINRTEAPSDHARYGCFTARVRLASAMSAVISIGRCRTGSSKTVILPAESLPDKSGDWWRCVRCGRLSLHSTTSPLYQGLCCCSLKRDLARGKKRQPVFKDVVIFEPNRWLRFCSYIKSVAVWTSQKNRYGLVVGKTQGEKWTAQKRRKTRYVIQQKVQRFVHHSKRIVFSFEIDFICALF